MFNPVHSNTVSALFLTIRLTSGLLCFVDFSQINFFNVWSMKFLTTYSHVQLMEIQGCINCIYQRSRWLRTSQEMKQFGLYQPVGRRGEELWRSAGVHRDTRVCWWCWDPTNGRKYKRDQCRCQVGVLCISRYMFEQRRPTIDHKNKG